MTKDLEQQGRIWQRVFRAAIETEKPNRRAALEEKIKFLKKEIKYFEEESKPVPQNILDKKADFERQLAELD